MHQNLSFFEGQKWFFSGEGPGLVPFTTPHHLDAYGASLPPYWNTKYATV